MSEESNIDIYRRRFLSGTATAAAGLAVAPGVLLTEVAHAKPADEAVTSAVRWGMLIDTNKCNDGCNDCVTACNEEHNLEGFGRPTTDAQWIRKVDPERQANRQCADACPCCASIANTRPAWMSARPAHPSSVTTASCWSTSTSASVAATA